MFENQRRYARAPLSADIAVRMKGQLLSQTICSNISMGGMSIVCGNGNHGDEGNYGKVFITQNYPDGAIVFEADFRKKWVKPVTLDGSRKRMGLEFEEIHPKHRDNLWRIIKRQRSGGRQIN